MLQELIKLALRHFEEREIDFPLPPRFANNEEPLARAWRNAIVDVKKIKSMAAALRKSPGAKSMPKRIVNNTPDECVLSIFFRNHEMRQTTRHWFEDAGSKFTNLDDLLPGMIARINRRDTLEKAVIPRDLIDILTAERLVHIADNLDFLERCCSRLFYESISEPLRDTLDLSLNLLLAQPGTERFAARFLSEYPWLAQNQPPVQRVEEEEEEQASDPSREEDAGPFSPADFMEFTRFYSKKIYNNAKPDDKPWGIYSYYQHYRNLYKLNQEYDHEAQEFLRESYSGEHSGIISGLRDIMSLANTYKAFESIGRSKDLYQNLLVDPVFSKIEISSEDDLIAIGDFIESRKSSISDNMDFLKTIHGAFKQLGKNISRLSEITTNQTGSLDEIVEITNTIGGLRSHVLGEADRFFDLIDDYLEAFSEVQAYFANQDVPLIAAPQEKDVSLLEASLAQASEKLAETEASAALVSDQLKQAYLALEAEKTRRAHYESQVDSLKAALHEARTEIQLRTGGKPSEEKLEALPVDTTTMLSLLKGEVKMTPLMILDTLSSIAPDRLVVLESARKSANEASNFDLPERLAQILEALMYPYLDSIRSGKPDSDARSVLPRSYAAKESDTVMKSPRLRAMREFNYNGQDMTFFQHVGVGRNYGTQHALRIYFKLIDDKVVVAYVGKHLETASTN